jgi:hypothetical protein
MGEERKVYKVLVGKSKETRKLGTPRCKWRMGLELILCRMAGGMWSGFSWLRIRASGEIL